MARQITPAKKQLVLFSVIGLCVFILSLFSFLFLQSKFPLSSRFQKIQNNATIISVNNNKGTTRAVLGAATTFTISGTVFLDNNRNGTQDVGETGYPGATLTLSGAGTTAVTTDAAGNYSFTNLPQGLYSVTLTNPAGYQNTTVISQSINLTADQALNFGITPVYTISGNVFADSNRDGTKNVGESGYRGATITLSGAASGTMTTDANGNYSFSGFLPGTYTVTISLPPNYQNTTPVTQTVTAGPDQTVNFGIAQIYTISGTAFDDRNRNGTLDPGETVYPGIAVDLTGQSSANTTTNGSGNYSFTNLAPGIYTITFTLPAKHKNTTAITQTFTLNGSQQVNFGLVGQYTISGNVFLDANKNGVQDGGESGYQPATVTLSGDASSSTPVDTNGFYSFQNVYEGNYTVALLMPSGYSSTTANSSNINLNADLTTMNFGIIQTSLIKVAGKCTGNNTLDIMIVFDHSGSMRDPDPATGIQKLAEAKSAAAQFVNIISANIPSARIGIVQMAGSRPNTPGNTWLIQNLTSTFSTVATTINNIVLNNPDGGTCFDCGMQLAMNELNNGRPNAQKMIIFMTDGITNTDLSYNGAYCDPGATCNGTSWTVYNQNAENAGMDMAIRAVNQENIIFNTIGIGSGGMPNINEPFLKQIANTNFGVYYNDPTNGNLQAIYKSIADNATGTGQITGHVFNDKNNNGIEDAGDDIVPNFNLQLTGNQLTQPITATTDVNGKYAFTGLCTANYTVTQLNQPPWVPTTPISQTLDVVTGNVYPNVIFGDRFGYEISGIVFNDISKNRKLDNGESGYTNGASVTSTTGTITNNPDGTYTITGLLAGTFTVSMVAPLPLPDDYQFIYPKNGPPPSFDVTVGPGCLADPTTGGACDTFGNITNLNFAISNSNPWTQVYGSDVRLDNGYKDLIPQNPVCPAYFLNQDASSTSPGIFFSGDTNSSFGKGQVSSTKWLAGGSFSPETFTTPTDFPLATSYEGLSAKTARAGIQPTDITTYASCANLAACSLPPNLPHGVYSANGDVNLNGYTFTGNNNYVFLINGVLTIQGAIQVQPGSTAVFAAAKDIVVDQTVGAASNVCPVPAGQIQGIFSTDRNFIINGINDCTIQGDKMLNIDGNVIMNAKGTGGSLINNRDLCVDNPNVPTVSVTARIDFLLNLPTFFMQQTFSSQEIAP